jgi:polar amino acid transport system substrate-binding protein
MKKHYYIWIFLSIAIFKLSLASAATITLVADEWPPFNIKPNSEKEGYIVEIARRVLESHGHIVVYKNIPWNRAIEMTRAGNYDGAIGASKTDAAGFIFPSEELAINKLAFYVKKGSTWRYKGLPSIREITLGIVAGYDYRQWLLEYIDANKNDQSKIQILYGDEPVKRNLIKMMNGRIEVVVDSEAAIRYVANNLNILDKIECAGYDDEPAFIYIAFSPNKPESTDYAKLLSEGISSLRRSGELEKILRKYGLNDWK